MKLSALLLAATLAANAALLAVYFNRSASSSPSEGAASTGSSSAATATNGTRGGSAAKNGAIASSASSTEESQAWSTLASTDLRTLVARLRAAGFPPSVVRAVVSAQISAKMRPRMEELMAGTTDEKPFWATSGNFSFQSSLSAKTLAALRESSREYSQLLKEALGDEPSADQNAVNRRYGKISAEKIEQVQRVESDYNDLRNEVSTAAKGLMLPEDREKLALLEKEKRADLAKILSPEELDDFLVRSSNTTNRLRTALTAMNATEDEFRAIYQAQSAYDEKYNNNFAAVGITFNNADAMKERQAAQAQVNEQLKLALGDQRFAEYTRSTDREFQTITRIAQQANLPAAAAVQVYDLRDTLSKESNRIFADNALTVDQKRAALQSLAQNTRAQITSTLGSDAGRTYLQVAATWLDRVERGGAVTFNPGGGTSTRNLPIARPPGAAPNPGAPPTTTTTTTVINRGG